jgi:hypothetical protein
MGGVMRRRDFVRFSLGAAGVGAAGLAGYTAGIKPE